MASINFATREVICKVVYYGPGRSGKTTNLKCIHQQAPRDCVGEMVSVNTETERTLYFDFLALDLGSVAGMNTKFQLYTVPGQVFYNATRKIILEGADGVVFVADSLLDMLPENVEALEHMRENLQANGLDPATIPLVFQWNKRDQLDVVAVEELAAALNPGGLPAIEAVALQGAGVFETLRAIASQVVLKLDQEHRAQMRLTSSPIPHSPVPAPSSCPRPLVAAAAAEKHTYPDSGYGAGTGAPKSPAPPSRERSPSPRPRAKSAARTPVNSTDRQRDTGSRGRLRQTETSRRSLKPVAEIIGAASSSLPPSRRGAPSRRRFFWRLAAGTLGAAAIVGLQHALAQSRSAATWQSWTQMPVGSGSASWPADLIAGGFVFGFVVLCGLIAAAQDRSSFARCFQLGIAWSAGALLGLGAYRSVTTTPNLPDPLPLALRTVEGALLPATAHRSEALAETHRENRKHRAARERQQQKAIAEVRAEAAAQRNQFQGRLDALHSEWSLLASEVSQLLTESERPDNEPAAPGLSATAEEGGMRAAPRLAASEP